MGAILVLSRFSIMKIDISVTSSSDAPRASAGVNLTNSKSARNISSQQGKREGVAEAVETMAALETTSFSTDTDIEWCWNAAFISSFETELEKDNEGNNLAVRNNNMLNINMDTTARVGIEACFSNQRRGIDEIRAGAMIQKWRRDR